MKYKFSEGEHLKKINREAFLENRFMERNSQLYVYSPAMFIYFEFEVENELELMNIIEIRSRIFYLLVSGVRI